MTPRIEEIDDTPSAFEIKICEMTSAVFHRDKSPYQANKVLFKGHAKALTEAHQAGVRDALVLIDKYDPIKIGERVNLPFYWGNELRQALNDTIKALQDNK